MTIKRTTKDSTRFVLIADCYQPKFGGYLKKGDVIRVPSGTPIQSVWTEVDEDGNVVPGGHVARRVSRHVRRPAGSENKPFAEIADAGAKDFEEGVGAEGETSEEPAAKHSKPAAKPSKRS